MLEGTPKPKRASVDNDSESCAGKVACVEMSQLVVLRKSAVLIIDEDERASAFQLGGAVPRRMASRVEKLSS